MPTVVDHSLPRLRDLAALAREAGELVMQVRREHAAQSRDMGLLAKADGSPVTRADHASEAHILAGLQRLDWHLPVVAEETANATDIGQADAYFLIDPVDGTRAFVDGGDDFSVNIGLVIAGVPVAGVLAMPTTGEVYYTDGAASYRSERPEAERRIAARAAGAEVDVIVNRTEDRSGRLRDYLQAFSVRRLDRRSSAHKLALVAAGQYDLYPRFGPTYEWDTAAGDAILRAAGGRVETADGKLLSYGKPGFRNPPFMAKGR